MKMLNSLLVFGLFGFAYSCKTSQRKQIEDTSGSEISGTLDDQNKMILPVPMGLEKPTTSSSQATMIPTATNATSGLGLAETNVKNYVGGGHAPTNVNSEGISSACWSIDTRFPNENWHFWAQVTNTKTNTPVQSTIASIADCGDLQVSLTNLVKTSTYKIDAAIYYQTVENGPSIVWYQGSTKDFTPGDVTVNLTLKKLLQDQQVNVEYEKSPKEQCKERGYFWNGYVCLDQPRSIVFEYTSTAQMTNVASATKAQKCMQFDSAAQLMPCTFDSNQVVTLRFYQKGMTSPTRSQLANGTQAELKEWYYITLGSDSSATNSSIKAQDQCLTSKGTTLIKAPCLVYADGTVSPDQLFSLTAATPSDNAGVNAFRISHIEVNTTNPLCIGVPADKYGLQGVTPFHDKASIQLVPCNISNAPLRQSQFIRFLDSADFGELPGRNKK